MICPSLSYFLLLVSMFESTCRSYQPLTKVLCLRLVTTHAGRLSSPAESILWYNVSSGHDYQYYNNRSSYTPLFNVTPSTDQQLEAQRICTVRGVLNSACVYDYYLTENSFASNITATTDQHYTAVQNMLGNRPTHIFDLTLSPPIPLRLYTLPYWSNPPFLPRDAMLARY